MYLLILRTSRYALFTICIHVESFIKYHCTVFIYNCSKCYKQTLTLGLAYEPRRKGKRWWKKIYTQNAQNCPTQVLVAKKVPEKIPIFQHWVGSFIPHTPPRSFAPANGNVSYRTRLYKSVKYARWHVRKKGGGCFNSHYVPSFVSALTWYHETTQTPSNKRKSLNCMIVDTSLKMRKFLNLLVPPGSGYQREQRCKWAMCSQCAIELAMCYRARNVLSIR